MASNARDVVLQALSGDTPRFEDVAEARSRVGTVILDLRIDGRWWRVRVVPETTDSALSAVTFTGDLFSYLLGELPTPFTQGYDIFAVGESAIRVEAAGMSYGLSLVEIDSPISEAEHMADHPPKHLDAEGIAVLANASTPEKAIAEMLRTEAIDLARTYRHTLTPWTVTSVSTLGVAFQATCGQCGLHATQRFAHSGDVIEHPGQAVSMRVRCVASSA